MFDPFFVAKAPIFKAFWDSRRAKTGQAHEMVHKGISAHVMVHERQTTKLPSWHHDVWEDMYAMVTMRSGSFKVTQCKKAQLCVA